MRVLNKAALADGAGYTFPFACVIRAILMSINGESAAPSSGCLGFGGSYGTEPRLAVFSYDAAAAIKVSNIFIHSIEYPVAAGSILYFYGPGGSPDTVDITFYVD